MKNKEQTAISQSLPLTPWNKIGKTRRRKTKKEECACECGSLMCWFERSGSFLKNFERNKEATGAKSRVINHTMQNVISRAYPTAVIAYIEWVSTIDGYERSKGQTSFYILFPEKGIQVTSLNIGAVGTKGGQPKGKPHRSESNLSSAFHEVVGLGREKPRRKGRERSKKKKKKKKKLVKRGKKPTSWVGRGLRVKNRTKKKKTVEARQWETETEREGLTSWTRSGESESKSERGEKREQESSQWRKLVTFKFHRCGEEIRWGRTWSLSLFSSSFFSFGNSIRCSPAASNFALAVRHFERRQVPNWGASLLHLWAGPFCHILGSIHFKMLPPVF